MLPHLKNDSTSPSERYCSQSKCRAILPEGHKCKTCVKCRTINKISMQKKWKQDKADEGPRRSPTTAMRDGQHDKESGTELKSEVSRMSSIFKMTLTQQTFQTNVPVVLRSDFTHMQIHRTASFLFLISPHRSPCTIQSCDLSLYDMIWHLVSVRYDLWVLLCTISILKPPLLRYLVLGEFRSLLT